MSVDETRVLIGGRKFRKIPPQSKLFVENEDPQGSVRQRHVFTSTPHHTTNQPPPPYNSPKYWSPPPSKSQPTQQSHQDSGFYGSFNTPDKSPNSYPSMNSSTIPHKSNLWDSITSPVSSIKNRITGGGRPNFLDDDRSRRWKMQPQQILGCLLFVTVFSSLGFALLISVKHFGVEEEGSAAPVNGKYQSLKFASEKINVVENADMSGEHVKEVSPVDIVSDPIFDVMNEIGQLSDRELYEKIKNDELGEKIKASGIKIESIDEMATKSNEIPSVDAISVELLTTRPFLVEHPAPTQAPTDKNGLKEEASRTKSKTTDVKVSNSDNENKSTNPEVGTTKSRSTLRKKSKAINPLNKAVEVQKVSKAKVVEKVKVADVESVDYPDLPTFRGQHPGEDETDDVKDTDYPEDPSTFR